MSDTNEFGSWLSIQEAHDLTGYEKEWLRQLGRLGKIITTKIGRAVLFDRQSLLKYTEDKKTQVS